MLKVYKFTVGMAERHPDQYRFTTLNEFNVRKHRNLKKHV